MANERDREQSYFQYPRTVLSFEGGPRIDLRRPLGGAERRALAALELRQLRALRLLDPQPRPDRLRQPEEARDLVLREQVHLQVEIGALVGDGLHPVLADEDERGEEDGLDGGRHRQDHERRVEAGQPGERQVPDDPGAEQDDVDGDEPHAAGEPRDAVGQALLPRLPALLASAALEQRPDVPVEHRGEAVGVLRRARAVHARQCGHAPARGARRPARRARATAPRDVASTA